ncbi:DNA-3-methyladenine glycosylase I [Moraxella oblonga]|uniref:DNA-3-methyladenine glycosylase I n=1 Tax=Moraxella oblonga TaxID=200413 RepID=UPI000829F8B9|nr:DNA-3-methyladenine glycosylase I [Moraxella oblonga]
MTNTQRCAWCLSDPLYVHYHDNEWGRVVCDDRQLFACLCLEGMQAGLSWITILKRRECYYQAFDDFDPAKIAQYDDDKVEKLMQNTSIIRHRAKILAIIDNAKAYLKVTQHQSFCKYLYTILNAHGDFPKDNHPNVLQDIPTKTPASVALAKQLKKDGFKFVGATTCYAFMQAVGMVNDHVMGCDYRTPRCR